MNEQVILIVNENNKLEFINGINLHSNKCDNLDLIKNDLITLYKYCPNRKYELDVKYTFENSVPNIYNLYKMYNLKEKGWIYNSYTFKKEKILELRVIQLNLDQIESCKRHTQDQMTQTESKIFYEAETQTEFIDKKKTD